MSNPAQGAEGAETMTAGQPVIRKAVFEIASRRIKSGAPGLAPATAEAIARIIGLEAAKALASPRADSDERTAGEALKEACKPWEHYTGEPPDDGSPLSGVFVAGMVYTERLLAKLLDVAHYEGGDGSEDFDADATQTLRNILTGARLWDADENRPVSATPAQPAGAVPDSLRALSEAASEDWDTNEATPYILGPPIDGEIDRFEVIARGPHGYAKNGDDIRKWQANRMFAVAAVKHVRTLLASHPAGQSAIVKGELSEPERAALAWLLDAYERDGCCTPGAIYGEHITPTEITLKVRLPASLQLSDDVARTPSRVIEGAMQRAIRVLLIQSGYTGLPSPASLIPEHPSDEDALRLHHDVVAYEKSKPAPDSTRTGQGEAEKLVRLLAAVSDRLRDNPPNGLVEGDLYVAAKNEGAGSGWRYVPTGLTVGDLDEARAILAARPHTR